jgi:hypothetical protein
MRHRSLVGGALEMSVELELELDQHSTVYLSVPCIISNKISNLVNIAIACYINFAKSTDSTFGFYCNVVLKPRD